MCMKKRSICVVRASGGRLVMRREKTGSENLFDPQLEIAAQDVFDALQLHFVNQKEKLLLGRRGLGFVELFLLRAHTNTCLAFE